LQVLYSIGAKVGGQGLSLVAQMAGEALEENGMLEQLVCYGKAEGVSIKKINRIYFQPAKLFSHLPSKYYYSMKRYWIDLRASQYLKKSNASIFHGWTHEFLISQKIAKSKNMITILERGNTHPLFSKKIMEEEYYNFGTTNHYIFSEKNSFMKKFNFWRYEINEAVEEIQLADYIFVNSDACAKTYIEFGVVPQKLIIIPRGFDPSKYFKRPEQFKKDKFILLFVGQLSLRKGVKYILDAWQKLNLLDAELWFVGSVLDEVKPFLNNSMIKFSNIKCFGNVGDPSSFYQKASAFVFPSLDEGSAKVTYEAMAAGLPCIFTENSGSLANSDVALIVPIRSSDAIADAVMKMYENVDYRNNLGLNAKRFIDTYTWGEYQRKLIETYNSIYMQ
jgi:glycosyltransferase involved in cell wall biosynthesis